MTESICNIAYRGSAIWLLVYTAITLISVIGNTLTIIAILTSKKLKTVLSNRFVLSLAVSDLLVGSSVPYHMVPFFWTEINRNKVTCLLRFMMIAFACASSINNLLLVAADRFVAIVHPLHYGRCMTKRVSFFLLAYVWTSALGLGTCLLYWNRWNENGGTCDISLAPQIYLNYLLAPLFVIVWTAMLVFYVKIVKEAKGHARRLKKAASFSSLPILYESSKSLHMVFIILGCFTITWFPYFVCITIIKTGGIRCLLFYEISFSMAVGNSAMNPLIYAWKNRAFRQAFRCLLTCRSPSSIGSDYITNHVPNNTKNNPTGILAHEYCNGRIEDLMKSEEVDVPKNIEKEEEDVDSELTATSELSGNGTLETGRYGNSYAEQV